MKVAVIIFFKAGSFDRPAENIQGRIVYLYYLYGLRLNTVPVHAIRKRRAPSKISDILPSQYFYF